MERSSLEAAAEAQRKRDAAARAAALRKQQQQPPKAKKPAKKPAVVTALAAAGPAQHQQAAPPPVPAVFRAPDVPQPHDGQQRNNNANIFRRDCAGGPGVVVVVPPYCSPFGTPRVPSNNGPAAPAAAAAAVQKPAAVVKKPAVARRQPKAPLPRRSSVGSSLVPPKYGAPRAAAPRGPAAPATPILHPAIAAAAAAFCAGKDILALQRLCAIRGLAVRRPASSPPPPFLPPAEPQRLSAC